MYFKMKSQSRLAKLFHNFALPFRRVTIYLHFLPSAFVEFFKWDAQCSGALMKISWKWKIKIVKWYTQRCAVESIKWWFHKVFPFYFFALAYQFVVHLRKEHVLVMLISILLWSAIFPCVFDISCFRFLVFLDAPFAFVAHLCTDRATLADRCPPHVPHRQKPYSARNYRKKIILYLST